MLSLLHIRRETEEVARTERLSMAGAKAKKAGADDWGERQKGAEGESGQVDAVNGDGRPSAEVKWGKKRGGRRRS